MSEINPVQKSENDLFLEKFKYASQNKLFIKLILSNPVIKNSELKKVTIFPVKIKNEPAYSHISTFKTKDITKNYNFEEIIEIIVDAYSHFLNADLFTTEENIQLFSDKRMTRKMIKISEPVFKTIPLLSHDRIKTRRINIEHNIYLFELGVTTKDGKIKKEMNDKFRQINKYLEILDHLIIECGFKINVTVSDMGSGKGYLTFALYDYLQNHLNLYPVMRGIEIRSDLVNKCNTIAKKCNFENLYFENSSILNTSLDNSEILIALHACDTATDDALMQGIKSNSKLIVVAPCCHQQIRKQMTGVNEFAQIMKHGILKERQAELITDGIRALILELYGYRTKVFEFVSSEHTPKNIMIACIKHNSIVHKEKILKSIKAIKEQFGIEKHYLEKLLEIVPI
jgi:hypothetical protein